MRTGNEKLCSVCNREFEPEVELVVDDYTKKEFEVEEDMCKNCQEDLESEEF